MKRFARATFVLAGCVLSLSMTACEGRGGDSVAQESPDGVYYSTRQDLEDEQFQPETLMIIEDGTVTTYTVHNGHAVKTETSFSVEGNKMLSSQSEDKNYNCNGTNVTKTASVDYQVTFAKSSNGIDFDYTSQDVSATVSLVMASEEDIERIQSLPECDLL